MVTGLRATSPRLRNKALRYESVWKDKAEDKPLGSIRSPRRSEDRPRSKPESRRLVPQARKEQQPARVEDTIEVIDQNPRESLANRNAIESLPLICNADTRARIVASNKDRGVSSSHWHYTIRCVPSNDRIERRMSRRDPLGLRAGSRIDHARSRKRGRESRQLSKRRAPGSKRRSR